MQPFEYLYVGTTPGLDEEFFERKHKDLQERKTTSFDVNRNAWKTRYDIKGMAEELKKQYGLTEKLPYTFEDERERHKKQKEEENADPIEKYKLTK